MIDAVLENEAGKGVISREVLLVLTAVKKVSSEMNLEH